MRAIQPDVTIVHVQRADEDGNAHCWGNFGVMIEGVRAAKKVIVVAEEIVASEVIASDPNRTVIPGFLVSAVVEEPLGAHPSPVQGYYKRDDAVFRQSLGSFGPVTDSRVLNVQPNKVTVVPLPQSMTLAEFAQRYPSTIPLAELAIVNQIEDPNKAMPAGTPVKQVSGGRTTG